MNFEKFKFWDSGKAVIYRLVIIVISFSLILASFFLYDMTLYAMEEIPTENTRSEAEEIFLNENEPVLATVPAEIVSDCMLTVEVDGKKITVPYTSTVGATVERAFEDLGIILEKDDYTSVPLDTIISSDLTVTVYRVSYTKYTEQVTVAAKCREIPIIYCAFSGRYKHNSTAVDGVKEVTHKKKIVNGEVVEDTVIKEKTIKQAKSGVKYVDKTSLLDKGNGKPSSYDYKLRIKYTAYTYVDVGGSYTSTGTKTKVGYVAVDPKLIPYHSLLYITLDNGFVYGYCYAKDCGGGIKGHRIDVFLPSATDCEDFGIRMGTCYVVRSGK